MPATTGIMLNFVPPDMRTMANSIANLSYNLLGYLPAPLLYGIAYEYDGGGKSHLGMWAIQMFTCVAFLLNVVACIRFSFVLRSAEQESKVMMSEDILSTPRNNEIYPLSARSLGDNMENFVTMASPAFYINTRIQKGKF